ncbi:multimerin-2a isoform X2 [Narcine bancroftii]|uniref:multimerin-2a isoform X2 n=1 Tax=Narcine bancroftii TaxID=1343680 RepID=UPI0038320269
MMLHFIAVFLSLGLVWLKEHVEEPANADRHKDFSINEARLGKQQVKPRHPVLGKVEGRTDTHLDGWGYEMVQGTNQPYSYIRTTISGTSRRQTSITRTRVPLNSTPDRNWCAFVKSRLSTVAVLCRVEPCVNGMVNCRNTVYQLKPMYKMKQMIVTSLEWRCCPGHTGSNCEHTAPEGLKAPGPFSQATGGDQLMEELVIPKPVRSADRDVELPQQQDDVPATRSFQQDFHEILSSLKQKENKTELLAPGLEDVVKSVAEHFLNRHFHSLWTSFNNSLADKVYNLSQDVEINRRNHDELLKRQGELEELGTKLKLKVDENAERLERIEDTLRGQQKRVDQELHAQRVNLDHNMTVIKTETDLKVKRSQKMIQIKSHHLNNMTAELRKDQDRLWLEVYSLNQRIAKTAELQRPKLCSSCNLEASNPGMTKEGLDKLSAALQIHSSDLTHLMCRLCDPTSNGTDSFQQKQEPNCTQLVDGLKREMNQRLNETRVGFMEVVLGLNVSLNHQSLGRNELISSLNNKFKELSQLLYGMPEDEEPCDCNKLLADYSLVIDNLRNASDFMDKMHFDLHHVKQQELELSNNLNDSVQDLFMALQQIRRQIQDLQDLQDGKQNILTKDILKLKKNSTAVMKELSNLKAFDVVMDSRIKYLNSSFSSLLEDALRHTLILENLLEEDILEITSEGATKLQLLSMGALYQILNETEKDLATHNILLENIDARLQQLEEVQSRDDRRQPAVAEEENALEESSSKVDVADNLLKPEYEALEEMQVDLQYKSSHVSSRDKDIEMLNLKLIELESHCNSKDHYYNYSLEQIKEEFTKSVETLQLDVSSLKELWESHIIEFQRFISKVDRLSNGTSRTGRGGLGLKWMRKQHREHHQRTGHLGIHRNVSTLSQETSSAAVQEFLAAFFVGLSNTSEISKILKFDHIFLNHGHGYSQEKGHFKALFKGIYMFIVTVEFDQGAGLGFLLVDSERTVRLQSSSQKQQQSSLVWGHAIVELTKGQHVWVEVQQGFVIQRTPPQTTFGGFLLFKIS